MIIIIFYRRLLALSNYYEMEEANNVLQYLLDNIRIIEDTEGKECCIPYAYFAISKYYELLMDFNEVGLVYHNI